jgi:hypothetical protein
VTGGGHVAYSAATVALVASSPEAARHPYYDLGQATMSIMLAEASLGSGSYHCGGMVSPGICPRIRVL